MTYRTRPLALAVTALAAAGLTLAAATPVAAAEIPDGQTLYGWTVLDDYTAGQPGTIASDAAVTLFGAPDNALNNYWAAIEIADDGTYYLIHDNGDTVCDLHTIDTTTGVIDFIGGLGSLIRCEGFDIHDGAAWVVSDWPVQSLHEIDLSDGSVLSGIPLTVEGDRVDFISAIATDPTTSILYGLAYNGTLFSIDRVTGVMTELFASEWFLDATTADFDANGRMWVGLDGVYLISSDPDADDPWAAFEDQGDLTAALSEEDWTFAISFGPGEPTPAGGLPSTGAEGSAAIAGAALLTLGGAALLLARRRKTA